LVVWSKAGFNGGSNGRCYRPPAVSAHWAVVRCRLLIDLFKFKFDYLNTNLTVQIEKLAVLIVRTPKNPEKS
jgi:hypothetical protein